MSNTFTEVSSQSWFSRIGSSIKGVLIGIVLFLAAFVVLFWNEGRSLKREVSLKQCQAETIAASPDTVVETNDGKPVHITGEAVTDETLKDAVFGISANAIKLKRRVAMYQWEEKKESKTRRRTGGGSTTETTYSYSKVWSETRHDSSAFKKPQTPPNPPQMPWEAGTLTASVVSVGAFLLSPGLVGKMTAYEGLSLSDDDLASAPDGLTVHDGVFYKAANPTSPEIGDAKVWFETVRPAVVSLISVQTGNTFRPYAAKKGGAVELLEMGTMTAGQMFELALKRNVMLKWILRLVGFVLMAVGIGLVFAPLAVVADVLPFLGSMLRGGIFLFAVAIALPLSLLTVSIAWLFYRPVIGALMLLAGVAVFIGLRQMLKGKDKSAAAQ